MGSFTIPSMVDPIPQPAVVRPANRAAGMDWVTAQIKRVDRGRSWPVRGFLLGVLGLRRGYVVLRFGNVPDVDDELVPVRGEYGDGDPDRPAGRVEGGTEDLEDRGVVLYPEEALLVQVGRTGGDPVPVADLLDAFGLFQVTHGALGDVPRHQEPRRFQRELHRVERGLQGPRSLVDEAFLVSADHLGFRSDAQPQADLLRRQLDSDLRFADPG